ncbi:hypothetical protein BVRB_2g031250 [Beta vulgaris subsp. vulgaris]|nr:hypothetical protein BVRB_2g031250 [Beta vulgaris subsp. vulgaris]
MSYLVRDDEEDRSDGTRKKICNICSKEFKTANGLQFHVHSRHNNYFLCPTCNLVDQNKNRRQFHDSKICKMSRNKT